MDIYKCILKLIPDYKCIVWENDYNKVIPNKDETRLLPTIEDLESVWEEVQIEENIKTEIDIIKKDILLDQIWLFYMISTIWEIGVLKGLWTNDDINNIELKRKYQSWKIKLSRLKELIIKCY